ncbi:hypothetical protein [Caulobacter sp. FWC26]|uniref:hypothetical protein n=1 Tax=Caulobacter sp. FWC26 TaxID=69665 RepID=UPI000C157CFC|nr:hypothetical protein [Caulobacter sp. FWC26]AZS22322.1 hypothetical protein CSW63_17785 [Caulobacter sp. FWC26]
MYETFDRFLATDTWHTTHDNDQERFYVALSQVIDHPDFNPDQMGEYMRRAKNVDRASEDGFGPRIDSLVTAAWAIRDYKAATST